MKNDRFASAWLGVLMLGLLWSFNAMPAPAAEPVKTAEEWKKLADQGDAEGQFRSAQLMGKPEGLPGDEVESAALLKKAAAQGHAGAQAALGMRYKSGFGVSQDVVEALEWLKKAAEKGDPDGQAELGLCYATGDGIPKDEVAAVHWLELASKAKSPRAESALNGMKRRGYPKDNEAAAADYKRGAYSRELVAQIAYAACLEEGRGLVQNHTEAARWYLKAAKDGDLVSKYRVGRLLQQFPDRLAEAYEWLTIAGIEGISAGRTAAEALKPKISPEQATVAEARAKAAAKPPQARAVAVKMPGRLVLPGFGAIAGPVASGTGFFISEDGYLVTNQHVVGGWKRFEVQIGTAKFPAEVIEVNKADDLAVLKVKGKFPALEIADGEGVQLGDKVFTMGFPMPDELGVLPKIASGEIAGLQGRKDDKKEYQVSVQLQHGNSGGALVDENTGKVVGVVRSILGARALPFDNGPLPPPVFYAVKSSLLLKFLRTLPEVQKSLFKPAAGGTPVKAKPQAEAAAALIWAYDQ